AVDPPSASVARAEPGERHRTHWSIGFAIVALLAVICAGGWWAFVEVPGEMARREAAAAEKARAEEQARQAAAEQARQAALAKAKQEEEAQRAAAEATDWVQKGNTAFDKQDYVEAMRWYRKAADQGDAVAQRRTGYFYDRGLGVAQDYAEALRWYRKAADKDEPTAQRNVGYFYDKGLGVAQDYAEAMRWYRKAADQGNAVAQNDIGSL